MVAAGNGARSGFGRLLTLLAAAVAVASAVVIVVAYLAPVDDPDASPAGASAFEAASPAEEAPPALPPRPKQPSVTLVASPMPASTEQLQDEARRAASELRSQYPDRAEALHVAAMMHAQLRETDEAAQLWQRAIELSPDTEQYYVNLAAVAMDRGNSELAATTLKRAVERGSTSPDVLHHLGVALNNLGRSVEAEKVVRQALESHPQSGAHWLVLGQSQLKQGQAAEAEKSLLKAVESGAASAEAYFALANAMTRTGKREEATKYRQLYSKLKEEQPLEAQERFQVLSEAEARGTAVAILTETAAVHVLQNNSLEAERLLLRAIALNPASVASCQVLADLYQQARMPAEERVVRARLAEVDPFNFANHLHLANVCVQQGELESAEAALKVAMAVQPENADAYAMLAQLHLQSGRPQKARWFAQESVRREQSAGAYLLLAAACEDMGDAASAQAATNMARTLDPQHPALPR